MNLSRLEGRKEMWSEQRDIFKVFFKKTEVQLTYNVVLISAVQQSDSDIYIYIYTHTHVLFQILFHYGLSQFSSVQLLSRVRLFEIP